MYARVLVPLDGSATARLALDHASHLSGMSGATIGKRSIDHALALGCPLRQ